MKVIYLNEWPLMSCRYKGIHFVMLKAPLILRFFVYGLLKMASVGQPKARTKRMLIAGWRLVGI